MDKRKGMVWRAEQAPHLQEFSIYGVEYGLTHILTLSLYAVLGRLRAD